MSLLKKARAVAGLAAVLTLLGLFVAEFFMLDSSLNPERIQVLIILITALLGLDLVGDNLPLNITVSGNDEDEQNTGEKD